MRFQRSTTPLPLILLGLLCALVLTACGGLTPSDSGPVLLPSLQGPVAKDCDNPQLLPTGALTQAQIEQLWARDRAALVECGMSKAALVKFYGTLANNLQAADQRGGSR